MDQNLNKEIELKDRLLQIFKNNKLKIFFTLIILIFSLFAYFLVEINSNKKNKLISEKYVRAGLYLASGDEINSKKILEEIILSKNNFYSILAFNQILEKNLVKDKNKINEYFTILDGIKFNDENKDLITFKKALYLIKNNESETGYKLLKKLKKKDSYLKPFIEEIIKN
tara:strand:+ start:1096 stop:1605 length:510 start_codon:yes stop_codon:yes gene_type:complete